MKILISKVGNGFLLSPPADENGGMPLSMIQVVEGDEAKLFGRLMEIFYPDRKPNVSTP